MRYQAVNVLKLFFDYSIYALDRVVIVGGVMYLINLPCDDAA